ncbi:HEPN domain-containing protein [Luteimonas sp. MC1828]|uniref:HEPN domain-containing protein n=1 Tax=Luteimonas sp. MC1828 TaxID=2799787 RepID=UPI0018F165A1|nr:HEPN domain-containing protein [Luteimonas sp. MC1828]MBJ7575667.1 hypothetical protein [Luteimonas sp. MC1828]
MNDTFVTALYNITISENLSRGDKINDTTFITNDPVTINGLLDRQHSQFLGGLEELAIRKASAVIYSHEPASGGVTPEQHLVSKLYEVEIFLAILWLFTDHSVNDETGFYFFVNSEGLGGTSNHLASMNTCANGEMSDLICSRTQLKRVREFYREQVTLPDFPFAKPKLSLTQETSRIQRALHHTMTARAESDIGFKISGYCSALEALLSSSQAELSHQLAERVAFLIGDSSERRLWYYKLVKQAYVVRSKIVHGDTVRAAKLPELIRISEFCDETIRSLVMAILSSEEHEAMFSLDNTSFDAQMLSVIFGDAKPLPKALPW